MQYKIIHFSETDISGGSSYYSYRVHKYFNSLKNINSNMFVLKKYSKDNTVKVFNHKPNTKFFNKINFFLLNKKNKYSFYNFGKYVINNIAQVQEVLDQKPKAIILYNNSNFIHPEIISYLISKEIKLFFYLTDMELITGGCHYNFECHGFKKNCNDCPATGFLLNKIANKNLILKKENFINKKLTFLVPNKNLKNDLISSSIFNSKKHKILDFNLSLDLKKYKQKMTKTKKKNKILITFRSSLNPRKGNQLFIKALEYVCTKDRTIYKKIYFNILGDSSILKFLDRKKISYNFYPSINNEKKLIKFYQKSDFFINQSIQDAGPAMVSEALSCGIPVLSFPIGISKDVIKNNFNGYLLNDFSITKFGDKIIKISNIKKQLLKKMKTNSRKTAFKNFDIIKQSKKIFNLIK